MIAPFTYESAPVRVLFGRDTLDRLPAEAARFGAARFFVVSTAGHAALGQRAEALLGEHGCGRFAGAVMHTPVEVTAQALDAARAAGAGGVVAIGGGSAIGLGKALAIRTDWPQITVPTTYAGSEMTPVLGEVEQGRKTTRRDPAIQPETVLYDVALTESLPAAVSGTSGLNAIAHGVEALYAVDRNPLTSLMAESGIAALAGALPRIVRDGHDLDAREAALYGAFLCGTCLGQAGMALHHKLCHTLGGSFGLAHAETHAVILPHAVAYNAAAAPAAMARLQRALETVEDPALALHALGRKLGVPPSLAALGFAEADIARAAELAAATPYPNPRPIDRAGIAALLRRAWAGEPPQE